MTSILLRNGYVVTVDPDRRVFPNGYVHVDGERIAAIGPMDRLAPAVADEVDGLPCKFSTSLAGLTPLTTGSSLTRGAFSS
jgi:hypothetical protein